MLSPSSRPISLSFDSPKLQHHVDVHETSTTSIVQMTSTLVETVQINCEAFAENFLSCSLCLFNFDTTGVRTAKLLPCSHTVCHNCLERIADLPQSRNTGSFRCPICRESCRIPANGVGTFPASFLINQLIDLMQEQRREVVPKCSLHLAEELLFCETCDVVFCSLCPDAIHSDISDCGHHNVVPFSIAIKRMSEIVLYKASHCLRGLKKASTNVSEELDKLDASVDTVVDFVNQSFQDLVSRMDVRRQDIISDVRHVRDVKRRILNDQLSLVHAEIAKVEQECDGLEYQTGFRNLSRIIGDLNQKLDIANTLIEPRENAFIRYKYDSATVSEELQAILDRIGVIEISKTFPPLCLASAEAAYVNLRCRIEVVTVDYNGCLRTSGGDPVEATLTFKAKLDCHSPAISLSSTGSETSPAKKSEGVLARVKDKMDGTYAIFFTPFEPGWYRLEVKIFGRFIKGMPLLIEASPHINPMWQFGGADLLMLNQPVKVSYGSRGELLILDTGNNRVKVCTVDGTVLRHISGSCFEGESTTGLAYSPATDTLFVLNWRHKVISEWSLDGKKIQTLPTNDKLLEPVDIAASEFRLLVLDSFSGGSVSVFDIRTCECKLTFPLRQPAEATHVSTSPTLSQRARSGNTRAAITTSVDAVCVAAGMDGDIIVGGSFGCDVYSSEGRFVRAITVSPIGGTANVSAVAFDAGADFVIACITGGSRRRQNSGVISSQVSVAHYKGHYLYAIDSHAAKLRRPSGLCVADDGHIFVADLGNNCIKKYRFK